MYGVHVYYTVLVLVNQFMVYVSIFGDTGVSLFGELNKAQHSEKESISCQEASLKAKDVVTATKKVHVHVM